jgi:group I intron endonuclease
MNSGIYKISSKSKSDRFYIGSALILNRRKTEHFRRLRAGTHPNIILSRHIIKYGLQDLIFSIVEHITEDQLITKEQYYIDTLSPYFNICKVAGTTIGRPQSDETKRKRADKLRGRKMTEEQRERMSASAHARHPIPPIINGFKLIQAAYEVRDRRRLSLFECPQCKQHVVRTRKQIERVLHCGCVKLCLIPKRPKPKKITVHGLKTRLDNTSGYIGVTYDKASGEWRSRVKLNGKLLDAGRYKTPHEASEGRKAFIIAKGIANRLGTNV